MSTGPKAPKIARSSFCCLLMTTGDNGARPQKGSDSNESWRFQPYNNRVSVYGYLSTVFDLVAWWAAEHRAIERARQALRLQNINPSGHEIPGCAMT
jgi:hypothetical protein